MLSTFFFIEIVTKKTSLTRKSKVGMKTLMIDFCFIVSFAKSTLTFCI